MKFLKKLCALVTGVSKTIDVGIIAAVDKATETVHQTFKDIQGRDTVEPEKAIKVTEKDIVPRFATSRDRREKRKDMIAARAEFRSLHGLSHHWGSKTSAADVRAAL